MDDNDVRGRVHQLSRRFDGSENPRELREFAHQLVPLMIAYWDVHPHSAMEMLEYTTKRLPIPLAHAFVRSVALGWRQKETYSPDAGGGAAHCYLSALILSENFDLAEHPWVDNILPYTLEKELRYGKFDRMRDGVRRESIVRAIADSARR